MTDPISRLNAALEGRYRIERQLGEGGMATVYLAEDLRHHRKVAIKVLKPELAAVVGAERFLAEIETTARLTHPHILPLHDSGAADGFLFFVIPYIEGDTLRDRIDREKQLGLTEAVRIAERVAAALDYAHKHGVVHRDIKPGNILLSAEGEPTIADFGIALAVAQAGRGRVTETGLSMGTPSYMSPEQATGDRDVDPRTDVYALGCVLYEMLIGEPPYTGSTAQAILGKIIQGTPVSATAARTTVPPNVDAVIRKALEKLPADRFGSALEFAKALGDPGFRHGETGLAGGRPAGLWNPLSIGATVAAVALSVIAFWPGGGSTSGGTDAPEVVRFTIPAPAGTELSAQHMVISPDGRTLVFRAGGRLYRRDLRSLETILLPDTQSPWMPFFAPDGESIGFFNQAEGVLRSVRLDGTQSRSIHEIPPTVRSGAWTEDGTMVVYSSGIGLATIPETGGDLQRLDIAEGDLAWIDLLPGGEVLGALVKGDGTTFDVALASVETGEIRTLFPGDRPRYAAGHILYYLDEAVWAIPFDAARLEVSGTAVAVAQGVYSGSVPAYEVVDDVLVYARGSESGDPNFGFPMWADRQGNEEPLPVPPGLYSWPRISPDGTRVALVRLQENADIWIYDLRTEVLQPLTVDAAEDSNPIWTADSERVVFRSDRDGPANLYWRRWDGSDEVERLTDSSAAQRPISVSPDGETLLFDEWGGSTLFEGFDVFAMLLEPRAPATPLLTEDHAESQAVVSPDGRFIAYQSLRLGYPEVYVRSYPDLVGERMVSTRDFGMNTSGTGADPREARSPVWSADGTELFYHSGGSIASVPVSTAGTFTPSTPVEVLDLTSWPFVGDGRAYDVHPDGDRFIRIRREGSEVATVPQELVVVLNWIEEVRARQ